MRGPRYARASGSPPGLWEGILEPWQTPVRHGWPGSLMVAADSSLIDVGGGAYLGAMPRNRTSKNYTIEPYRIGLDQQEIGIFYLNFRAENLASAQAQAMIYLRNDAFVKDIDGAKLLRDSAVVWRWTKVNAKPPQKS
jgi:hypothetical protein